MRASAREPPRRRAPAREPPPRASNRNPDRQKMPSLRRQCMGTGTTSPYSKTHFCEKCSTLCCHAKGAWLVRDFEWWSRWEVGGQEQVLSAVSSPSLSLSASLTHHHTHTRPRTHTHPGSVGPVNCYQSFHGVLCSQRLGSRGRRTCLSSSSPNKILHAVYFTTLVCRVLNILAVGSFQGVETLAREIVKPLVLAW